MALLVNSFGVLRESSCASPAVLSCWNASSSSFWDAHLLPHLGEHGHVAEEGDAQHQLALRVENRIGFEDQLPPVGNGLHARGGCPVRMTSGFSTTSSLPRLTNSITECPSISSRGMPVISAWRLFKCTTVPSTSEMQIPSLKASKADQDTLATLHVRS